MNLFDKKENCTGCETCKDICPTNAITMEADKEGFLYPVINDDKCMYCSLCINICPITHNNNYKEKNEPEYFVTYHKSKDVLKHSTSGGAFTALSDAVLENGGTIYGAMFEDHFKISHRRATSKIMRNKMRISKYVQSSLDGVYESIKKDLKDGKEVLFTGTPCQTSGMRARFQSFKYRNKLYICDLICHSVPSPKIWQDYISLLEEETHGLIEMVQFRSKKYKWSRKNSNKGFLYKLKDEDNYREDHRYHDLFTNKNYIVRPSCYNCKYTDFHRASDITIADYWGIEKYDKAWYNPLGVSLILVNTKKGKRLFNNSKKYLVYQKRPKNEAISEQNRLTSPSIIPNNRNKFWDVYYEKGLKEAIRI